jgi:hypothetical protein
MVIARLESIEELELRGHRKDMIMNDHVFNLFIRVSNAAKTGNYVYGNGANWHIVEGGKDVFVNTQLGTVEVSDVASNAVAVTDMNTVRNIEQFLMSEQGTMQTVIIDGYHNRKMAVDAILHADKFGDLLYTNGAQYSVRSGGLVTIWDIGNAGRVTVTYKGALASWQHLTANGGYTVKLSEDTKNYIRI